MIVSRLPRPVETDTLVFPRCSFVCHGGNRCMSLWRGGSPSVRENSSVACRAGLHHNYWPHGLLEKYTLSLARERGSLIFLGNQLFRHRDGSRSPGVAVTSSSFRRVRVTPRDKLQYRSITLFPLIHSVRPTLIWWWYVSLRA